MLRIEIFFMTMMMIVTISSNVKAARILGFFPSTSKSHLIVHCAIADVLAEAGHNVTVIATFPNVYKDAKYHYIYVDAYPPDPTSANEKVSSDPQSIFRMIFSMMDISSKLANASLSHPTTQQFLRDHKDGDFDLMILGYFGNDLHLGVAAYFKCPIIVSFMIQTMSLTNAMVGNPNENSYVPLIFTGLGQPMNFIERVRNCLAVIVIDQIFSMLPNPMQKLYNEHFPPDRFPLLSELKKNISLVFTNHHFSQGPIRPYVPAMIEIGGIQIRKKIQQLPVDLVALLDKARDGVIYLSFGSKVDSKAMPRDVIQNIYNVLSRLRHYIVLWQWNDINVPGNSSNIVYRSWLPQNDILAHPKIKLFVTHGGMGSVAESVYHGIPIVGIPLMSDQPGNIQKAKRSGYGLSLDYRNLTEQNFENAVVEVLTNQSYRNAVQQFSRLYRDRPMTPQQLVLYWTEYVIRHHGAPHMQSPAVHMNHFQLLSLDVIAFLIAIIAIAFVLIVKLLKLFCWCCCRKKGSSFVITDSLKIKKIK